MESQSIFERNLSSLCFNCTHFNFLQFYSSLKILVEKLAPSPSVFRVDLLLHSSNITWILVPQKMTLEQLPTRFATSSELKRLASVQELQHFSRWVFVIWFLFCLLLLKHKSCYWSFSGILKVISTWDIELFFLPQIIYWFFFS